VPSDSAGCSVEGSPPVAVPVPVLLPEGAAPTVTLRACGRPDAIVPLVGWLGFAGLLNAEIWRRNR